MKRKSIASDPPAPPAETSHPFHPGHKLKLVTADDLEFHCDGCKEHGAGARYTCEQCVCDFDLHTWCALAPDVLEEHPLLEGRAFVLLHEPPPPDPAPRRVCDACGDVVRGFVYHCFDHDIDLHPCCARLPGRLALDGLAFELCVDKRASCRRCAVCAGKKGRRKRRKFWSYRSDCDDGEAVYLHVACVKEMACESLKASGHHRSRDHGGGKIVQVEAPVLKGVLRKRAKTSSKGKRFLEIATIVVRVIIGVIFGDPTAMIVAVVGLIFNNG